MLKHTMNSDQLDKEANSFYKSHAHDSVKQFNEAVYNELYSKLNGANAQEFLQDLNRDAAKYTLTHKDSDPSAQLLKPVDKVLENAWNIPNAPHEYFQLGQRQTERSWRHPIDGVPSDKFEFKSDNGGSGKVYEATKKGADANWDLNDPKFKIPGYDKL